MNSHSSDTNGLSASYTPGSQGIQEDEDPVCLQQQTHQDARSDSVKKDRYVTIENSTVHVSSFLVKEVGTVSELIQKICDRIPSQKSEAIGLRVSGTRMGSPHRSYFSEELPPDIFDVYVSLYLKKHPAVPPVKIEHANAQ